MLLDPLISLGGGNICGIHVDKNVSVMCLRKQFQSSPRLLKSVTVQSMEAYKERRVMTERGGGGGGRQSEGGRERRKER